MNAGTFHYTKPFPLERGGVLPGVDIAYYNYGKLNEKRDNVIFICHALTANADAADWWPDMIGEGLAFDTNKYFIICANVIGSCYGSSGPLSINSVTGKQWGSEFPLVTVRDIVKAHILLAEYFQFNKIKLLAGGSLGGQQCLEWAILQPDFIENLFLIASNAKHSAWGIACNETQRMVLSADNGLAAARAIAMLSYRNYTMYENTQSDTDERYDDFRAISYQQYQGKKLKSRFNNHSYYLLSKAMDAHNVGRNRGGIEKALSAVKARTLVTAITSDALFPPKEQKYMADNITNSAYTEIDSPYGHDGFLIETKKISQLLRDNLNI